jgi:hypothetical protein
MKDHLYREKLDPKNIVCQSKTVSGALKKNSYALKFSTQNPKFELTSPYVEAEF